MWIFVRVCSELDDSSIDRNFLSNSASFSIQSSYLTSNVGCFVGNGQSERVGRFVLHLALIPLHNYVRLGAIKADGMVGDAAAMGRIRVSPFTVCLRRR